jgi:CRISPR-associated endonuclease Csn1
MSKVAREYMSLICPNTRVIPGRMTAMLRGKFGLNDVLGLNGEKNRNDHRHHAVDACVIAVTDQGLLQRFAKASASAREQQLNRLVENMTFPWGTDAGREYFNSVKRAIDAVWVSHKPDHSHEGAMHEDTAYCPPHLDKKNMWRTRGIGGNNPNERDAKSNAIIAIHGDSNSTRHARTPDEMTAPYKGYVGGNNFCIEIVRDEKGKWEGEVISTFEAYNLAREHGTQRLRHPNLSISDKPLVMRLMIDDVVRLDVDGRTCSMRVAKIGGNGQIFMALTNEANIAARNSSKEDAFGYTSKTAGTLKKSKARRVSISPIGELRDLGFKE